LSLTSVADALSWVWRTVTGLASSPSPCLLKPLKARTLGADTRGKELLPTMAQRDHSKVSQQRAAEWAQQRGVDPARLNRLLGRLQTSSAGCPLLPEFVAEESDIPEDAIVCGETIAPPLELVLDLLFMEDLAAHLEPDHPDRVWWRETFLLRITSLPYYTLDELADLLEAYIDHRERNRDLLIQTGYPNKGFALCPWLDQFLTPVFPTKLAIDVGVIPVGASAHESAWRPYLFHLADRFTCAREPTQEDTVYTYRWAAASGPLESLCSDVFLVRSDPPHWALEPMPRCDDYQKAVLIGGLTSEIARDLEGARRHFLRIQIGLLEVCVRCLRERNADGLWPAALTQLLHAATPEEVQGYLSANAAYDTSELTALVKEAPYPVLINLTGGILGLVSLLGYCEGELRIGKFHKAKQEIEPILQAVGPVTHYWEVAELPIRPRLDRAIDAFWEREKQADEFHDRFIERVDAELRDLLQTQDIKISPRLRLPPEPAQSLNDIVQYWVEFQVAHWKATGQLSSFGSPLGEGVTHGLSAKGRESAPGYLFQRKGQRWHIVYQDCEFDLNDLKGLGCIAYLLGSPNKTFGVLELEMAVEGTSCNLEGSPYRRMTGGQLEDEGLTIAARGARDTMIGNGGVQVWKEALKRRHAEKEMAIQRGDQEAAAAAQDDLDRLQSAFRAMMSRGGLPREFRDEIENARNRVGNAIRSALTRIQRYSEPLYRHLDNTIQRGETLGYAPDQLLPWQVDF
jgi:hypothetical protein